MVENSPELDFEEKALLLSPVDNIMPRLHMVKLLCIPIERMDQKNITNELALGWEALFNELPVLSGMLHDAGPQDTSGRQGRLKVLYPKNKATDVLAFRDLTHRSDLDYHLLRKHHFPMHCLKLEEMMSCLAAKAGKMDLQNIVAMVQVNFVPNGLIIARAFHHSLMDGFGMVTIMRLWATLCRGESINPSIKPNLFNRAGMLPKQPPGDINDIKEFVLYPKQIEWLKPAGTVRVQRKPTWLWACMKQVMLSFFQKLACAFQLPKFLDRLQIGPEQRRPNSVSPPEVLAELFFFSQKKLDELKRAVVAHISQHADQKTAPYVSTNDILSAFLFVGINKARIATAEAPLPSTFPLSIVVSARGRKSPPVPTDYTGNAALFIHLDMSQEEATDISTQNIAAIAQHVRRKVLRHDAAYIERLISTLEQVEDISRIGLRDLGHPYQFIMTSGTELNIYDIEWGPAIGAKCEKLRPSIPNIVPAGTQGVILVHAALREQRDPAEDGLEVLIWLEKYAMARLKAMKEWNEWCQWRCNWSTWVRTQRGTFWPGKYRGRGRHRFEDHLVDWCKACSHEAKIELSCFGSVFSAGMHKSCSVSRTPWSQLTIEISKRLFHDVIGWLFHVGERLNWSCSEHRHSCSHVSCDLNMI